MMLFVFRPLLLVYTRLGPKIFYIFKVTPERLNAMSGPSVTAANREITDSDDADFSANAELSAESDEV
jgi:hypothetical protein